MEEIPNIINIFAKSRSKTDGRLRSILTREIDNIEQELLKAPIFLRRNNIIMFPGNRESKTNKDDRFYRAILNPFRQGIMALKPSGGGVITGEANCMIVAKCQKDGSNLEIDTIEFFGEEKFEEEFTEIK